jgi:hypothetical protein
MEAFGAALASCHDVTPWSEADAAEWWRSLVRSVRVDATDTATAPTLSIGREAPQRARG